MPAQSDFLSRNARKTLLQMYKNIETKRSQRQWTGFKKGNQVYYIKYCIVDKWNKSWMKTIKFEDIKFIDYPSENHFMGYRETKS